MFRLEFYECYLGVTWCLENIMSHTRVLHYLIVLCMYMY